jgi:hypothetical protein
MGPENQDFFGPEHKKVSTFRAHQMLYRPPRLHRNRFLGTDSLANKERKRNEGDEKEQLEKEIKRKRKRRRKRKGFKERGREW